MAVPNREKNLSFHDLAVGGRLLWGLPRFLHARLQPERARWILEQRLRERDLNFLRLMVRAVYGRRKGVYLALLRNAGCQFGDLVRMVRAEGVEAALAALFRAGVYLTAEEYKGRREVVRGGIRIKVTSDDLHNPLSKSHLPVKTSGSRGSGTPFMMGLDFIAECAVNSYLDFLARGGGDWVKADWEIPGGGALFRILKYSRMGKPPERWFSHFDPSAPGIHSRYRWSVRWLRGAGLMTGTGFPKIEHVPLEEPRPIALWMRNVLDRRQTPFLITFGSSAVRVARVAFESGIDLCGAKFMLGGEPATRAKLEAIAQSGAEGIVRYGSIETGPIGYGCLHPDHSDDVHFHSDLYAVIQPGEKDRPQGVPPGALFLTGLSEAAPFLFLNVSLGDQAVRLERQCGCPIEKMGLSTHLHSIRSYEKLTVAGMTFMDIDIVSILEEDLPRRFGGVPSDYQLVEEEGGRGEPVLRLLVHPRLGALDEAAVAQAFLEAVGRGSSLRSMMGRMWQESDLIKVERRPPLAARSGKILHLISKTTTSS